MVANQSTHFAESQYFPPPVASYFDSQLDAWVLSRYDDVLAAFREPALEQASPPGAPLHSRRDLVRALSQVQYLKQWQTRIEPLTHDLIGAVPKRRPLDLVTELIQPWSFAVARIALELDPGISACLAFVAPHSSGSSTTTEAHRSTLICTALVVKRRLADLAVKRLLTRVHLAGSRSLFLGITQTLPSFLANAWLALLQNPDQRRLLRDRSELAPRAVEELLRYASPVHTLTRTARKRVTLANGLVIEEKQRVILKVSSANRDPRKFRDSNVLDICRADSGHLGLGLGPHACVGAQLVRLVSTLAIDAFVQNTGLENCEYRAEWRHGAMLSSLRSLVLLS